MFQKEFTLCIDIHTQKSGVNNSYTTPTKLQDNMILSVHPQQYVVCVCFYIPLSVCLFCVSVYVFCMPLCTHVHLVQFVYNACIYCALLCALVHAHIHTHTLTHASTHTLTRMHIHTQHTHAYTYV